MTGLKFKVLGLDDKELIGNVFKRAQPVISEYTFSNLFAWRHSRPVEYASIDRGLLIKVKHQEDDACFLPPVGFSDLDRAYQLIIDWAQSSGQSKVDVFRVPESHIDTLKNSGWKVEDNRDQHDYVYLCRNLCDLPGRKLENKRGFIRKFDRENEYEYRPYDDSLKEACLELAQIWMAERNPDDPALLSEYRAIQEYLEHFSELRGCGSVFIVNDRVISFCFGEELNNETFVVHFEKADTHFSGIYQAINQRFMKEEIKERYKYVNREQDLGIPGIRKAKLSYYPEYMVRKYQARFSL